VLCQDRGKAVEEKERKMVRPRRTRRGNASAPNSDQEDVSTTKRRSARGRRGGKKESDDDDDDEEQQQEEASVDISKEEEEIEGGEEEGMNTPVRRRAARRKMIASKRGGRQSPTENSSEEAEEKKRKLALAKGKRSNRKGHGSRKHAEESSRGGDNNEDGAEDSGNDDDRSFTATRSTRRSNQKRDEEDNDDEKLDNLFKKKDSEFPAERRSKRKRDVEALNDSGGEMEIAEVDEKDADEKDLERKKKALEAKEKYGKKKKTKNPSKVSSVVKRSTTPPIRASSRQRKKNALDSHQGTEMETMPIVKQKVDDDSSSPPSSPTSAVRAEGGKESSEDSSPHDSSGKTEQIQDSTESKVADNTKDDNAEENDGLVPEVKETAEGNIKEQVVSMEEAALLCAEEDLEDDPFTTNVKVAAPSSAPYGAVRPIRLAAAAAVQDVAKVDTPREHGLMEKKGSVVEETATRPQDAALEKEKPCDVGKRPETGTESITGSLVEAAKETAATDESSVVEVCNPALEAISVKITNATVAESVDEVPKEYDETHPTQSPIVGEKATEVAGAEEAGMGSEIKEEDANPIDDSNCHGADTTALKKADKEIRESDPVPEQRRRQDSSFATELSVIAKAGDDDEADSAPGRNAKDEEIVANPSVADRGLIRGCPVHEKAEPFVITEGMAAEPKAEEVPGKSVLDGRQTSEVTKDLSRRPTSSPLIEDMQIGLSSLSVDEQQTSEVRNDVPRSPTSSPLRLDTDRTENNSTIYANQERDEDVVDKEKAMEVNQSSQDDSIVMEIFCEEDGGRDKSLDDIAGAAHSSIADEDQVHAIHHKGEPQFTKQDRRQITHSQDQAKISDSVDRVRAYSTALLALANPQQNPRASVFAQSNVESAAQTSDDAMVWEPINGSEEKQDPVGPPPLLSSGAGEVVAEEGKNQACSPEVGLSAYFELRTQDILQTHVEADLSLSLVKGSALDRIDSTDPTESIVTETNVSSDLSIAQARKQDDAGASFTSKALAKEDTQDAVKDPKTGDNSTQRAEESNLSSENLDGGAVSKCDSQMSSLEAIDSSTYAKTDILTKPLLEKNKITSDEGKSRKRQRTGNEGATAMDTDQVEIVRKTRTDLQAVKLKLYNEGKLIHTKTTTTYERLFSDYWNALSLRIADRQNEREKAFSMAILNKFLRTKKLRKLHNKLILGT
jgi:hypothetical protein